MRIAPPAVALLAMASLAVGEDASPIAPPRASGLYALVADHGAEPRLERIGGLGDILAVDVERATVRITEAALIGLRAHASVGGHDLAMILDDGRCLFAGTPMTPFSSAAVSGAVLMFVEDLSSPTHPRATQAHHGEIRLQHGYPRALEPDPFVAAALADLAQAIRPTRR